MSVLLRYAVRSRCEHEKQKRIICKETEKGQVKDRSTCALTEPAASADPQHPQQPPNEARDEIMVEIPKETTALPIKTCWILTDQAGGHEQQSEKLWMPGFLHRRNSFAALPTQERTRGSLTAAMSDTKALHPLFFWLSPARFTVNG